LNKATISTSPLWLGPFKTFGIQNRANELYAGYDWFDTKQAQESGIAGPPDSTVTLNLTFVNNGTGIIPLPGDDPYPPPLVVTEASGFQDIRLGFDQKRCYPLFWRDTISSCVWPGDEARMFYTLAAAPLRPPSTTDNVELKENPQWGRYPKLIYTSPTDFTRLGATGETTNTQNIILRFPAIKSDTGMLNVEPAFNTLTPVIQTVEQQQTLISQRAAGRDFMDYINPVTGLSTRQPKDSTFDRYFDVGWMQLRQQSAQTQLAWYYQVSLRLCEAKGLRRQRIDAWFCERCSIGTFANWGPSAEAAGTALGLQFPMLSTYMPILCTPCFAPPCPTGITPSNLRSRLQLGVKQDLCTNPLSDSAFFAFYQNVAGATTCRLCPANTRNTQHTSTFISGCVCRTGFFSPAIDQKIIDQSLVSGKSSAEVRGILSPTAYTYWLLGDNAYPDDVALPGYPCVNCAYQGSTLLFEFDGQKRNSDAQCKNDPFHQRQKCDIFLPQACVNGKTCKTWCPGGTSLPIPNRFFASPAVTSFTTREYVANNFGETDQITTPLYYRPGATAYTAPGQTSVIGTRRPGINNNNAGTSTGQNFNFRKLNSKLETSKGDSSTSSLSSTLTDEQFSMDIIDSFALERQKRRELLINHNNQQQSSNDFNKHLQNYDLNANNYMDYPTGHIDSTGLTKEDKIYEELLIDHYGGVLENKVLQPLPSAEELALFPQTQQHLVEVNYEKKQKEYMKVISDSRSGSTRSHSFSPRELQSAFVTTTTSTTTAAPRGVNIITLREYIVEICFPTVGCLGNQVCAHGYRGSLCARCQVKFFKNSGTFECEACGLIQLIANMVLLGLATLVVVGLIAFSAVLFRAQMDLRFKVVLLTVMKQNVIRPITGWCFVCEIVKFWFSRPIPKA